MDERQIGGILTSNNVITDAQLKGALSEQRNTSELLGNILVKLFCVDEHEILKALSEQFHMPLITLKDREIDWDFVKKLNPSFIFDSGCFPVSRDDEALTVAITDPRNEARVRKAENKTGGFKLKFALISEQEMNEVMFKYKEYMRDKIGKLLE